MIEQLAPHENRLEELRTAMHYRRLRPNEQLEYAEMERAEHRAALERNNIEKRRQLREQMKAEARTLATMAALQQEINELDEQEGVTSDSRLMARRAAASGRLAKLAAERRGYGSLTAVEFEQQLVKLASPAARAQLEHCRAESKQLQDVARMFADPCSTAADADRAVISEQIVRVLGAVHDARQRCIDEE